MSKEIYISSTPHETRLAIVENDALTEIYYERENEYTLAGSIYNGKVTRVLPGMQSSFVDIGLERDAFLYITDFMEEAGDSAEFDTNGNGDSSRRRDRGDRNGSAPTIEGTVVAGPDQAADSGSRNDRNDRNGRGDRGRGRGRRDRGGNRDRQPLPDAIAPTDSSDAPDFNRDDFSSPAEFTAESTPASRPDEGELGEGAPGADGNRRWRGRRGRRRGRGPGQRDESPQIAGAPTPDAPADASFDDDSFDIDGAAAPTTTAPIAAAYSATEPTAPILENTGRNDRGDRNDRNGRGTGDRNDRNRGNRNNRGGRDSRAPRGFAPRTSLYGVEDAPAHNQNPELDANAAEPIVLPGESLSKYRKGGEMPTAAATKPARSQCHHPSSYRVHHPVWLGWRFHPARGVALPPPPFRQSRRFPPCASA